MGVNFFQSFDFCFGVTFMRSFVGCFDMDTDDVGGIEGINRSLTFTGVIGVGVPCGTFHFDTIPID